MTMEPTEGYLKVLNRAVTVKAGETSKLRLARELGRNFAILDGRLAVDEKPEQNKPLKVTVENPTLFAARILFEKLGLEAK